jgi:quinol monooxygenase YgiN
MLDVFVRLHCAPGREPDVRAALSTVVTASRTEPGCRSIHAFQSVADPLLFFIHSVWDSPHAFDRHATLPHTTTFIHYVDPLLDQPREVHRTDRLP